MFTKILTNLGSRENKDFDSKKMDQAPKMEEYFDLSMYGSTETGEDPEPTERSSRKPLKTKRIEQTGNGYYGARYYDPRISVWLRVDDMSGTEHNRPLTPYHFSANNPVIFIDPDGNDWFVNDLGTLLWVKGQSTPDKDLYPGTWKNIGCDDMFGESVMHEGEDIMKRENGTFSIASTGAKEFLNKKGFALVNKMEFENKYFTSSEHETNKRGKAQNNAISTGGIYLISFEPDVVKKGLLNQQLSKTKYMEKGMDGSKLEGATWTEYRDFQFKDKVKNPYKYPSGHQDPKTLWKNIWNLVNEFLKPQKGSKL
tara:strand:+ start:2142 stop:3077 length:936 start_codon:yes stop_codon:yes gene_type:complete